MGKMTGGSTVMARCLKKEGVTKVFTLSGGHTMSMYYACADAGIEVIDCRSEANAVMAADAYAKTTGKPGVVLTTAGPGVSNTVTGMLEAMTGRTPVVQIGGACQLSLQGTGDMQDVDNLSIMQTCTKWARRVYTAQRIADHLDDAFRHATSGIPGPVYVEIAVDILMDVTDEDGVSISAKSRTRTLPYGDPEAIDQAARMLLAARRPLMVIGNSARYSCEPQAAVRELAEYLDLPVTAATIGRGLFLDEDHPLCQAGPQAARSADVVLALCTANDLPLGKFQPPAYAAGARFIMVHTDAQAIGFNREAEVGIVAGAAPAARQILERVKALSGPQPKPAYLAELIEARERVLQEERKAILAEARQVRPGRCAYEVSRFLEREGRDWSIVIDGGDSGCWMNKLGIAHRPGQILGLIGNGSIGLAPGSAVGAWHGAGRPVLLYTGDGSFGYNLMEFSHYVRANMPVVVVVSNDSAWGMVKGFEWVMRPQVYARYEQEHPACLATSLPFVHYEKMAEILGGYGELVERAEDIVPAIRRAAASGRPAIVNVRVEDICEGGYSSRTSTLASAFARYAKDYV